eukprot:TRINITY_DN18465_c0_g1_i2.p1 TRINITY_DN18465_c0_g1~~TRINITY_DN18465_c0_g1_i2.p1  ORF type:complete len:124 (+),score=7.02 TRINITY_DN18465_c0_g1_i2:33-374(+)
MAGAIASDDIEMTIVPSSGGDDKYDIETASLPPGCPLIFIFVGVMKYVAIRNSWAGDGSSRAQLRPSKPIDLDAVCDCLASTNLKPVTFPQPVPLAEMVNLLVELWEEEGLYD